MVDKLLEFREPMLELVRDQEPRESGANGDDPQFARVERVLRIKRDGVRFVVVTFLDLCIRALGAACGNTVRQWRWMGWA